MSIPRSARFIVAALAVYVIGFAVVLTLILHGMQVPPVVAFAWFGAIVALLLCGLIATQWD